MVNKTPDAWITKHTISLSLSHSPTTHSCSLSYTHTQTPSLFLPLTLYKSWKKIQKIILATYTHYPLLLPPSKPTYGNVETITKWRKYSEFTREKESGVGIFTKFPCKERHLSVTFRNICPMKIINKFP